MSEPITTPPADDPANVTPVPPPAPDPGGGGNGDTVTLSKAEIDKLKSDLAAATGRLAAEQKKRDEAEAKRQEEQGEWEARAKDLKAKLADRDLNDAVRDVASKLGANNVAAVLKLVKADLKPGEDGAVSSDAISAAVEAVKADLPELFKTPDTRTNSPGAPPADNSGKRTLAAIEADEDEAIKNLRGDAKTQRLMVLAREKAQVAGHA